MRKILVFLAVLALFLESFEVSGQNPYSRLSNSENVEAYRAQSDDSIFTFKPLFPFTALAIKSKADALFSIILQGTVVNIPKDEDVDQPTYFISLPGTFQEIQLLAPTGIVFELFAIQSGEAPIVAGRARENHANECSEPISYIQQSTWRDGLPAPSYSRFFHTVSHNIVHHSAGSNTNSNYTQVVRDIYLYHTQVNGWSDIGYNYLISQDGTTYAGRDPGGGSQDNVRGAHFCGANSGTLGICLLGNYETATPTSQTWSSLETLLNFQLINQGLDPFETFNHALGTLGVITGHREGCSTLCPGENVFSRLEQLRTSLEVMIESCQPEPLLFLSFSADTLVSVGHSVGFTNTSEGYDHYLWNLPGASPQQINTTNATTSYSVPGSYNVILIGTKEGISDTLQMNDRILVSSLQSEPIIFPNPATASELLSLDFVDEIQRVELFSINGRLLAEWEELSNEVRLPSAEPGIYLLNIYSNGKNFRQKLFLN